MITKRLEVGPSAYSMGGSIHFHRYEADQSICIHVIASDGSLECIATVCLADVGLPAPDHVWLRDWGGNEGVPEALAAAGVVELIPDRSTVISAQMAKLTPAALAQLQMEIHP